MIKKTGVVARIVNDKAYVRIPREASCDDCEGCGSAAPRGERSRVVRAVPGLNAGDRVRLEGRAMNAVAAGLTFFILPLLLFFAGFSAGAPLAAALHSQGGRELSGGLLGGVLGIFAAALPYLLLAAHRALARRKGRYELQITARLSGALRPGERPRSAPGTLTPEGSE